MCLCTPRRSNSTQQQNLRGGVILIFIAIIFIFIFCITHWSFISGRKREKVCISDLFFWRCWRFRLLLVIHPWFALSFSLCYIRISELERSTVEVLFGAAAERQRRNSAASARTGCDSLLVFFTCSIEEATVSRGLVLLKKFQLPQPFIFCQPGGNLVSSK